MVVRLRAEEYDSDYNGELDFWEFRKVLRTPPMTKKLGFLGLGCEEAESLWLGAHCGCDAVSTRDLWF